MHEQGMIMVMLYNFVPLFIRSHCVGLEKATLYSSVVNGKALKLGIGMFCGVEGSKTSASDFHAAG